jgi:hypothetical protein
MITWSVAELSPERFLLEVKDLALSSTLSLILASEASLELFHYESNGREIVANHAVLRSDLSTITVIKPFPLLWKISKRELSGERL